MNRRRTEKQTTQPSPIPKSVQNSPPDSVPITTTIEPRVNPNDTTKVQEGQSSVTSVREASAFPKIPPTSHELTAILQFGTTYELVEWLARRLQEVSERTAQEHQDQIMIQKTLRGTLDPQEQQEINRIGRHRNAKNKGEAIQMPPLHEALMEVHKEYAKASRASKYMVDMYKKATTAADLLNAQCTASQAENQRLSKQCRQTEELLKKTREEMLQQETRRLVESEQEWQQIFQQAEDALKQTEARAVLLENRTKTLEDQQHLAQTEFGNQLTEKEDMIRRLRRQSAHQQDEVRHATEQIEELEEYVKIQESYWMTRQ